MTRRPAIDGGTPAIRGGPPAWRPAAEAVHAALENSLAAAADPVAIDALWDEVFPEGRAVLQLRLKDNGPGIPTAALDKLFQPFNTTKTHGLGLGLATARRIVEAHDGSIVLSDSPPAGAEFTVMLPRARA